MRGHSPPLFYYGGGIINVRLKQIGVACRNYRRKIGLTQKQVSIETHYSSKTISSFETGHLNNATLLLWYLSHGLKIDEIEGVRVWRSHVKE